MARYRKLDADEPAHFMQSDVLQQACCDCGLVHKVRIFADGENMTMYTRRDKRATAQLRRYRYGNLQQTGGRYDWEMTRPWKVVKGKSSP